MSQELRRVSYCVNCGASIKTKEDLVRIDKRICCKYCYAPRVELHSKKIIKR